MVETVLVLKAPCTKFEIEQFRIQQDAAVQWLT
jgi:hypothetical protein